MGCVGAHDVRDGGALLVEGALLRVGAHDVRDEMALLLEVALSFGIGDVLNRL
jgi:hypothetical protein